MSKQKLNSPHVAARIYYLTPKEGGRTTPVQSGYRGQFHIYSSDWDAQQELIDVESCNPGEAVNVYIAFASAHEILPLGVGSKFEIREGIKVVGRGEITVIIDQSILHSSSRKNLYKLIDEITWSDWDPIGVNKDISNARDEYYAYLPTIFSLVLSGRNNGTIAQYLHQLETDKMGLPGNLENCLLVAEKILRSFERLKHTGDNSFTPTGQ